MRIFFLFRVRPLPPFFFGRWFDYSQTYLVPRYGLIKNQDAVAFRSTFLYPFDPPLPNSSSGLPMTIWVVLYVEGRFFPPFPSSSWLLSAPELAFFFSGPTPLSPSCPPPPYSSQVLHAPLFSPQLVLFLSLPLRSCRVRPQPMLFLSPFG